jgi:hypothetical protein
MTNLPAWQLTTAELAREIGALEASSGELPPDDHGRLGQLYRERDARKRLAGRMLSTAGQRFPEDAS